MRHYHPYGYSIIYYPDSGIPGSYQFPYAVIDEQHGGVCNRFMSYEEAEESLVSMPQHRLEMAFEL